MVVELNDRETVVIGCCIGIEIKNLESEQIQLEERIDRLSRCGIGCEKMKERLDVIHDRLPELYALEKKFQEVLESVRS